MLTNYTIAPRAATFTISSPKLQSDRPLRMTSAGEGFPPPIATADAAPSRFTAERTGRGRPASNCVGDTGLDASGPEAYY